MKFNKKNIYIALFTILYVFTAFISMTHAVAFFSLANVLWMGIILAITFEIGQAAVLFSILTDRTQRSKIMPWCLMIVLTAVQILGNVFSSYKYILTNSVDDLKYFKEPIFVWTDLPDNITTVIVTYLLGAILPVICLLLTSMVTGFLDDTNENKVSDKVQEDEPKNEPIDEPKNDPIDEPKEDKIIESENHPLEASNNENNDDLNNHISEEIEENLDGLEDDLEEINEDSMDNKKEEIKFPFEELENEQKRESKFINL